ncbi:hypothetical protein [Halomonas dongshanensis]|uniref:Uncharacterized protein n=1 Tax=Halomonas dongshanensis TaxID=2890835 RepID=A0ABT2EHE1_9GAMM|nr:hypothetical protein [Halomonas dongshanensis]MCS2610758.1 hypothetical protein [Halomonas dongshanensis]
MIHRYVASIAELVTPFSGYGDYWRFTDARSVQLTTSDRVALGGQQLTRCHSLPES